MIGKKRITGIVAACIMIVSLCVGSSVFAANNGPASKKDVTQAVTDKAQTIKEDAKAPQTHEDLVAIAAEVGINIDGMTDDQIKAALVAYKKSHCDSKIDGLPPHDHLIAVATEVGINTTGMTDEQIEAALTAYKLSHQAEGSKPVDLQLIAKKLGIDTTGMTEDQIKAAISEKGKKVE